MNNKITATHETGQVIVINKSDEMLEFTVNLMRECGYIEIRIERECN